MAPDCLVEPLSPIYQLKPWRENFMEQLTIGLKIAKEFMT